jgi:hypothetical protein
MIDYRNDWVHSQAPSVGGLGVVWERRSRWHVTDDGTKASMLLVTADAPRTTIDTLVASATQAFADFAGCLEGTLQRYYSVLEGLGVEVDRVTGHMSYRSERTDYRTRRSRR